MTKHTQRQFSGDWYVSGPYGRKDRPQWIKIWSIGCHMVALYPEGLWTQTIDGKKQSWTYDSILAAADLIDKKFGEAG